MAFSDVKDKQKFRDNEELNTANRARLLKIPYVIFNCGNTF